MHAWPPRTAVPRRVVLDRMTGYFIGKHEGETTLAIAFIVALANQVTMHHHPVPSRPPHTYMHPAKPGHPTSICTRQSHVVVSVGGCCMPEGPYASVGTRGRPVQLHGTASAEGGPVEGRPFPPTACATHGCPCMRTHVCAYPRLPRMPTCPCLGRAHRRARARHRLNP